GHIRGAAATGAGGGPPAPGKPRSARCQANRKGARADMDVFRLRDHVISDYSNYVRSFLTIHDERIDRLVREEMEGGFLWPDPLIQLNPAFEPGETLEQLIRDGELHPECINIFREKGEDGSL